MSLETTLTLLVAVVILVAAVIIWSVVVGLFKVGRRLSRLVGWDRRSPAHLLPSRASLGRYSRGTMRQLVSVARSVGAQLVAGWTWFTDRVTRPAYERIMRPAYERATESLLAAVDGYTFEDPLGDRLTMDALEPTSVLSTRSTRNLLRL